MRDGVAEPTFREEEAQSSLLPKPPKLLKGVNTMKQVALKDVKDDLLKYLQGHESVLITSAGKPAGVLLSFASEDDCYDYLLRNDPQLLQRLIEQGETQRSSPKA